MLRGNHSLTISQRLQVRTIGILQLRSDGWWASLLPTAGLRPDRNKKTWAILGTHSQGGEWTPLNYHL